MPHPDCADGRPDGTYGFAHWVLYNIPADVSQLPEGVSGPYTAGLNQTGESGYAGPQPPPGHGQHHYFFWLLALRSAPEMVEERLNLWRLLSLESNLSWSLRNRLAGTFGGNGPRVCRSDVVLRVAWVVNCPETNLHSPKH